MAKLKDISKEVSGLIKAYNLLVKGIETKANDDEDRAYGGVIRAGKGLLVESMCKRIIEIAWKELGGESKRLSLEKQTVKIPLNKKYISRIKSPEIKEWIKNNIYDFYYTLKTDVHIYIDEEFVIGVECKAYAENAMLKRILVDFTLFKQVFPNLKCVLLELESQLGGDYGNPEKEIIFGSHSTHTLLSHFDVDLHIITLLDGERKVDKPIHKKQFYKALKKENLLKGIGVFKDLLKEKI